MSVLRKIFPAGHFITVAVAALELAQTILEEEVLREAHMSAPTGFFIRMNRAAEELEPEAMAQAKQEDRKVDQPK